MTFGQEFIVDLLRVVIAALVIGGLLGWAIILRNRHESNKGRRR